MPPANDAADFGGFSDIYHRPMHRWLTVSDPVEFRNPAEMHETLGNLVRKTWTNYQAPLVLLLSRFTLGAEHVLEGFDEGVATMRQGERALLTLEPLVAYGSLGARDEKPGVRHMELDLDLQHHIVNCETAEFSLIKNTNGDCFKLLLLKVWHQGYLYFRIIGCNQVLVSLFLFFILIRRWFNLTSMLFSTGCLNRLVKCCLVLVGILQSAPMDVAATKEGMASTSRHRCDLRCAFIGGKDFTAWWRYPKVMPWCWAGI